MIFSVLLSCAIIAFLYYYIIYNARYRRLINLIPGEPQIPLFGDILFFIPLKRDEAFTRLIKRVKIYGTIQKAWCFLLCLVSISHPDDVQVIMNNAVYNPKAAFYKYMREWLNDGLLLSEGTKWQERRKILTPAFHFTILKNFFEVLTDEAKCMTDFLKNMDNSIIENLSSFISHHTLNIICETSMGISLKNISAVEQKQYRDAIHDVGAIFAHRFVRPWMFITPLYRMTHMHRKEVKYIKTLHEFTEKIITERKQYHKSTGGRYLNFENNAEDDEETNIYQGRKKRLALLDILIEASTKSNMSDLDIREEVDTFMFEGHDTVAMALTFSILMLAEHKDVQDRVREEVNAVMAENGGKLTMAGLQNLTYLERCLKETMRLYPSVYVIMRRLDKDAKLRSYVVPAGAQLHIDIYNLHRNPEFWPNPDVFDPDRFLPEAVEKRHPFAYVPFSAGSRNCIGQRFAMMELKTVIGTLIHNFYLEAIDYSADLKFHLDLILRPMYPLRVKFVPV